MKKIVGESARKVILAVINIILIFTAVVFTWAYSSYIKQQQTENGLDAFGANIESMKQVSENYLRTEQGYVNDWAKYINYSHMTVGEALDYIRHANNQEDRYAHIVDMDTYEAYSSIESGGGKTLTCYQDFMKYGADTRDVFVGIMSSMLKGEGDSINILGKYRTDDTQANVVSVGTKVTLKTTDGTDRNYLLLRIIPVESLRKIWVFPVEYTSAEIGLITNTGDYVVASRSMKGRTFAELIRSYNFEDDYNRVDELIAHLKETEKDTLEYRDSRGRDCYWYYSRLDNMVGIDILGFIPKASLEDKSTNWIIVAVICGVLFMLIVIDGSYILLMNRELRRTAQLARDASEAKSRFLSTMSHDIRTPMNGIIGMTNIAMENVDNVDYTRKCLGKVLLASDHLLTLVNDILDVSKIESGNMVLTKAPFSVEKLLDKLVDIVQTQMKQKKIEFVIEKDIQAAYLVADELRINQIYINILSNAVKYTPDGGKIKLILQTETLGNGKARVKYVVSDTGIGMSQEFQMDMYHLFTREVDSKIAKTQGTGLGLAIVKQMVELMDGEITCESALGKGTTFTIVFDLEQTDLESYERMNDTQQTTASNDFDGIRVLVAEDNDLNWEIVQQMLSSLHASCDRVCDGKECVTAMENAYDGEFDLILMDIQMPVMNGREAARCIRNSDRNYVRNIPIYAMTADAFAEDVEKCIKAGMNGHLSKPLNIRRVCEVLRKVSCKTMNNNG